MPSESETDNEHEKPSSNPHHRTSHTSDSDPTMKIQIDPTRTSHLLTQYTAVLSRISAALPANARKPVRLVAVSKLKPASDILALHSPPHPSTLPPPSNSQDPAPCCTHFGENYIRELLTKSRVLPPSIRWHFIGTLQSNKCHQLAREVRGLWCVESVDSVKKARLLDKGRGERKRGATTTTTRETEGREEDGEERLRVFVQVNTSGEDTKSGVAPPDFSATTTTTTASASGTGRELLDLCTFILDQCPNLDLRGLMTIGALARSTTADSENGNEDFVCLRRTRDWVVAELGGREGLERGLELSMGMSSDFETAVRMGSDEVRVGSTIFGERPSKSEAKVLEGGGPGDGGGQGER